MAISLRTTVAPVLNTGTLSVTTTIASTAYLAGDLILVECVSYCVGQTAVLASPAGLSGVTWIELGSQTTAVSGEAVRKMWYARLASNVTGSIAVTGTESVGTFIGVQIAAVALRQTTASPIGASARASDGTTNNLTTTAIVTTGANSWVFAQGYEPTASASGDPTSSDLTIVATQNAVGNILGYKIVATSGTSTTTNLDAVGVGAATWAYQVFEILADTAAAAGSATATGTASMSNARTLQGTATGTATGTAAASNQRTLAASASATASGTAAMSSTQAMSASGSVTATGTAAADVTSVVTVDASATVTASGTASMSSTQAMSASATITATGLADGSIRPLVTVDGAGTITATGSTTFNKSQALAASASATASATASLIAITTIAATASVTATATATLLITTPGSLYGNAAKVAGLYGSSTKPTLTTRS